jgi:methyl-CpG-binding domain protein 4
MWEPPASPFGLIEEQLFTNPWKLLVACLLLNKTTAQAVRKVILHERML